MNKNILAMLGLLGAMPVSFAAQFLGGGSREREISLQQSLQDQLAQDFEGKKFLEWLALQPGEVWNLAVSIKELSNKSILIEFLPCSQVEGDTENKCEYGLPQAHFQLQTSVFKEVETEQALGVVASTIIQYNHQQGMYKKQEPQ
jgi:hypothetical protein